MKLGTWLVPMVARAGVKQHWLPHHTLNEPVVPGEVLACERVVESLPAAAVVQCGQRRGTATCEDCAEAYEARELAVAG